MADTWLGRMKRHENQMEARLKRELLTLATIAATVYAQHARKRTDDGRLVIEDTPANRQTVKQAMWNRVVSPYFGSSRDGQLDGQRPLTPFMTLIRDGVEGAIQIQAERQLSVIEKYAPDDVYRFLTGPRTPQFVGEQAPLSFGHLPKHGENRPLRPAGTSPNMGKIKEQGDGRRDREIWYDPFHLFVDENGYRLSDRGWRVSTEVRKAIDMLLDTHIQLGTSAVDLARILEIYLYPEAARVKTRTPYGYDGSYWARRLARTEITAAAGRSTINAALLNPFVEQMDWRLSLSHPCCDICDDLAAASPYDLNNIPPYPAHPHELCTLAPKVISNRAERVAQIRAMMQAGYDDEFQMGGGQFTRRDLQGAFRSDFLVPSLVTGNLVLVLRKIFSN